MSKIPAYSFIARAALLAAMENLEYYSRCDFCSAGECDDDGGDKLHSDECPFFGFDRTEDWYRLKIWAKDA